ncbi:hypothetical protein ACTFIR_003801 [Dictyostelium discoideum]
MKLIKEKNIKKNYTSKDELDLSLKIKQLDLEEKTSKGLKITYVDFKREKEQLFGNHILKDSIINQKDKIIKLNNSTYKINYQLSKKIHCNGKVLGKNVTLSNNNQPESHNLLDDDEDIKKQATKFVESIPSQIFDMLSKTNPEE